MQSNEITLSVNEDNDDGTTAEIDHVYERIDEQQNRSVYGTSLSVPGARDVMALFRSYPKVNGNFKGVGKTSAKFTKDFDVDGIDSTTTISAPYIIELSVSGPIGVSAADQMIMRQKVVALLNLDSVMIKLHNQLII